MDEKDIRVVIVDDEPLARKNVRILLKHEPDVQIAAECRNGPEAVRAIRSERPDAVFLDIQMPGMSGFEVLEQIGTEISPVIVFVTAWDEHAVRAFEYHALDYLLKPFSDARFRESVDRIRDELRRERMDALGTRVAMLLDESEASPDGPAPDNAPPRRFVVRSGGRVVFLRVADVAWIEAADYYARLHVGSRSHLIRESLNGLESRLDSRRFVRVHRNAIVNLDHVDELCRLDSGRWSVRLANGRHVAVSRRRRERLEIALSSR